MLKIEEYDKIRIKLLLQYIKIILLTKIIFLNFFGIYNYKYNYQFTFSPYSSKITKIKVRDGKLAKIGIISDSQLKKNIRNNFFNFYGYNMFRALKIFKKHNIDIIILAGDITINGEIINYLYFKEIYNSVYENNQRPILISLMGNHDYMDKKYSKLGNQKKFFKYMNSYPFAHYLINNYNFIFLSYSFIIKGHSKKEEYSWLKSRIENARKNKKKVGDPIFIISHMPPKKTVYGSENYSGNKDLYDILKNYPEVISISGHSHYSLRNKKSIWQGEFTALNIQSISYIELDKFYSNYLDVVNSSKNDSMGLMVYLNRDNVIFDRIQFSPEEILEERWNINFPMNCSNFIYKFKKMNKKINPFFVDKNKIKIKILNKNYNKKILIIFKAAFHQDYVYKYKIVLKNIEKKEDNKIYYYYSDYYKSKKKRQKILKFEIPNNINRGKYNIDIYAIDTFGNISKPKKGIIISLFSDFLFLV